jgi:hypothetical protein
MLVNTFRQVEQDGVGGHNPGGLVLNENQNAEWALVHEHHQLAVVEVSKRTLSCPGKILQGAS